MVRNFSLQTRKKHLQLKVALIPMYGFPSKKTRKYLISVLGLWSSNSRKRKLIHVTNHCWFVLLGYSHHLSKPECFVLKRWHCKVRFSRISCMANLEFSYLKCVFKAMKNRPVHSNSTCRPKGEEASADFETLPPPPFYWSCRT